LAVRDAGAGKLAGLSQWLCVLHLIETGYLHSAYQACGMAGLAMGAQYFGWFVVSCFGFMHVAINLAV
jgi:uncharacterized membrane protein